MYGRRLPSGLRQAERLPEPIFTATTKAEAGHDLPLTDAEAAELVGAELFERIRDVDARASTGSAPRTPSRAASSSPTRSSSSAPSASELLVIDEMLTPGLVALLAGRGVPGRHVAAVVRQAVRARPLPRDRLGPDAAGAAAPAGAVIEGTRARYVEAYELLTGRELRRVVPAPRTDEASSDRRVRLTACGSKHASRSPTFRASLDPQGATVERALPALGYDNVSRGARRQEHPAGDRRARRGGRPRAGRRDVPAPARQPRHRGVRDRAHAS